ncbi:MAG: glycosyltransferase [Blastochloris viridis]|uniref:Glycosyltransferase n=1 Tax=Blastochloris viridis TaxID=1079 RepID=A0A6N4RBK8_BLAVI|nr:MAG: glycosyltransferase [Blastochloris viridis]
MAKTQNLPRIAAVMAAHNADKTLIQAVESLLIDKVPIDVYIVDDASKKPVTQLFDKVPEYVYVLRQENNVGAAKARNIALKEILVRGYEYVAVMDSDDIALPGRIRNTIAFLDANPKVAAVGGWAHCVDEDTLETLYDHRHPCDNVTIKARMNIDARFVHSTVTFRSAALKSQGFYDENYPIAQDYEIMMRLAKKYELANLPEFLLLYRISKNGISVHKMYRQRVARLRIQLQHFRFIKPLAWYGLCRSFLRVAVPNNFVVFLKKVRGV